MSTASKNAAQANDSPSSVPEDPSRRYELLDDCRELVVSRLSKVIGEALAKMGDELSALAMRSRDPDEQQALMDAVSVVRQHRNEIELRFRRSFGEVFERRLKGDQGGAPRASEEQLLGELALVDDAVLQAKLAVDRLVGRTRGRLDPDEVLGVRARLAALLDREWFEEEEQPAAPEAVFEALKSALDEIAPRPDVQAALLDAFEPHVSANLNKVYNTVNERLKAGQVLPRLRPQVARPRRPTGAAPSAPGEFAPGVASGQSGPPGAQGAPAAQAYGAGQMYPYPAGQGYPAGQAYPGLDMGGMADDGAWMQPGAEVGALLAQLEQGVPAARAGAARLLSDPEAFEAADPHMPGAALPLLDALSGLQSSGADLAADPRALLADLADRARETGSPLDQLTVEIVSMVFDYIYADKRLADTIKQQLLRLQVVAVKAALIDRSFFARRAHPMRRLIDRITDLGTDADADLGAGAPLVKGIESVVEWVLQSFDRDLRVFDEARQRVDALEADESARRAERIAQVTREAERAEAIVHARGLAMARLSDRLDSDTPDFVRDFLTQWWSLAVATAQIGGPVSTIDHAEAMSVGEGLIWSVQPKQAEEVPRLAALLPRLINGLMRGIRLVAMPDERREVFFNDLLQAHTRAIEAAKHAGASARRPANLRMRTDGRIQFVPVAPPAEAERLDPPTIEARSVRISELRRGDALEVDVHGDGVFLNYRLAWVSPAQRMFVISRFPEGALSIDRGQLAALFDSGRARVPEGASPLDEAIESAAGEAADPGGDDAAAG